MKIARRIVVGLFVATFGAVGYVALSPPQLVVTRPAWQQAMIETGQRLGRDGRGRYGRSGDTGPACTLYEGTAINYLTYSQELDNGAWTSFADVTAPTVTANAAVAAPACSAVFNLAGCGQTGVVDRVQFPATGIGHFSGIRNIHGGPGGGGQWDEYIYAIAGPGGCPDGLDIGSSDTEYFFTHHAVGASWVRISDVAGASTAAGSTLFVGNLGQNIRPTVAGVIGVVARAACDVYLWQADANVQGDAHRPVKTTSSSASQGPICL